MSSYQLFYELRHSDGTLIDKCWDKPLRLTIGDTQMHTCLESCISAAKIGQTQTFLLDAEHAFGTYDKTAVQTMSRKDFAKNLALKPKRAVVFKLPSGQKVLGYIKSVNKDNVVVDFNHLLAGEDIAFKVKVLEKI